MRKLLLIALLAVASAAEAQNVVSAGVAPVELLQEPAPAPPAQPAPTRPPSAPRPPATARPAPAPATAAPPAAPAPPASAPRPAPAVNIRFDVTITDTGGPKPVTKTLSLTVGNYNNSGSIRSVAQVPGANPAGNPFGPQTPIPLNVDVRNVMSAENNAVRASILVEYQPYVPEAKSQPGGITASAQTIFFDGRKTQILVTSDPISDRKTTIEVTATILK